MYASLVVIIDKRYVLSKEAQLLYLSVIERRNTLANHIADAVLCKRNNVKLPLNEIYLIIFSYLSACR